MSCFLVPPNPIETTISSIGPAAAGYNFTLTCTVVVNEGLRGIPAVYWLDSSGQRISSTDDVTINALTSDQTTNVTLYFDPIRASDSGNYTCSVTLAYPPLTLLFPQSSSASYSLDVQQSKFIAKWLDGREGGREGGGIIIHFPLYRLQNSSEDNGLPFRPRTSVLPGLLCAVDLLSRWSIWTVCYQLDIIMHRRLLCPSTVFTNISQEGYTACCG